MAATFFYYLLAYTAITCNSQEVTGDESEEELSMRAICTMDSEIGPCRALIPRFFYNRYTQRCQEFDFGGCNGNANNFETYKECRMACRTVQRVAKKCRLEPETGRCRAAITRHFYNMTTGQCESFVFGGCGGNDNNFRTTEECVESCRRPKTRGIPKICLWPAARGNCEDNKPRYFYNVEKQACETFHYSGCDGNDNNFANEETCKHVCSKDMRASTSMIQPRGKPFASRMRAGMRTREWRIKQKQLRKNGERADRTEHRGQN
ncbi:unnamed protein product [Lampetra fluviatilis]